MRKTTKVFFTVYVLASLAGLLYLGVQIINIKKTLKKLQEEKTEIKDTPDLPQTDTVLTLEPEDYNHVLKDFQDHVKSNLVNDKEQD